LDAGLIGGGLERLARNYIILEEKESLEDNKG
jgi:hypothetical protein